MISQTTTNEWIYLSPHLDDAALSCGGLISQQTSAGVPVTIITVCAGDAPLAEFSDFARGMHARWGLNANPPAKRRVEDELACRRLGAKHLHLTLPDCIYRRAPLDNQPLYTTEEALFGPLDPAEDGLITWLAGELHTRMGAAPNLVCPMAIGGHVDHRLTHAAAEQLGEELFYYADYPYVLEDAGWLENGIPSHARPEWEILTEVLNESSLIAWEDSVAAFASQIPVFWQDEGEMRTAIRNYYLGTNQARLWRRNPLAR